MKAENAKKIAEINKDWFLNLILSKIGSEAKEGKFTLSISQYELEPIKQSVLDLGYTIDEPNPQDEAKYQSIRWGYYDWEEKPNSTI
jgi:hypothetical protein